MSLLFIFFIALLALRPFWSEHPLVLFVLCSLPLAGYSSALILEKSGLPKRTFRLLGILLAVTLGTRSDKFGSYLDACVSVGTVPYSAGLVVSILSAVTFVIAAVSFALLGLSSAIELPSNWLLGRTPTNLFPVLRPLIVISILSICFNLVVGLFVRELWPTVLVGGQ